MIIPAFISLGIVVILTSLGMLISDAPRSTLSLASFSPTSIPSPTLSPIPSPTLSPMPSPTAVATVKPQAKLPSLTHLFNLRYWKLTLPIGSIGKPTEIRQPELNMYILEPWFIPGVEALRFRAPVNGVTTGGSKYPRSELREMTGDGTTNASWASSSGTHVLFLDEAVTAVPKTKQHVVAGQIHDADDDVIVIRLESSNLYVNADGKNVYTLDSNYTLGKRFTIKFMVKTGKTEVYYNNSSEPVYTLSKNYSGAYFKAGAYTQSNCDKEGSNLCNPDNFGEVIIYKADVTHTT